MEKKNLILITTNFVEKNGNGGQILTRYLVNILAQHCNLYIITLQHAENTPSLQEYNGIKICSLQTKEQSKLQYKINKTMNLIKIKPKFFDEIVFDNKEIAKISDFINTHELQNSILLYNYIYTFAIANILESIVKTKKYFYIAQNVEYELLFFKTITSWINSNILRIYEAKILRKYFTICLTQNDCQKVEKLQKLKDPNKQAITISPIITPMNMKREPISNQILITTNLAWWPNIDSINWFFEKVYPLLDQKYVINITGKDQGNILKDLDQKYANVNYLGFVSIAELDKQYLECEFIINPTIKGGGFQVKMLEALAYGVPVISTDFSNHLKEIVCSSDNPQELAKLVNTKKYNPNTQEAYQQYYNKYHNLLINTLNI
jgi:glycosyltransferase involved in cell wall biosynthesis